MLIYEYPKCSTCRAAKKFINEKNIDAKFIDVTKEQPSKEDINKILEQFNIDIKKLFNTSGLKYRELGLKDKLPTLNLEEKIDILLSDGMLIKRPIAFNFDKNILLVGFKTNVWEEKLI